MKFVVPGVLKKRAVDEMQECIIAMVPCILMIRNVLFISYILAEL